MTYHNGMGGVRQAMAGVRQAMAGGLGTGFDVSHYGSPYKGMLGLGTATPYTGAPAADPRIVKRYSLLKFTYRPVSIPSAKAADAANMLLAAARTAFAGHTVSKIGTTGWTSTTPGRVGYQVRLATDTRLGELRSKSYQIGQTVGPRIVPQVSSLADARTDWTPADLMDPVATTPTPTPGADVTVTADASETISGGLPSWAPWVIAGGGILVVGGLVIALTRKKPAAVAANRRRRRSRRSSVRRSVRRNSRSSSLALQAAKTAVARGFREDLTVTQTYNEATEIFERKMKKAHRTPVAYDYQLLKKAVHAEILSRGNRS